MSYELQVGAGWSALAAGTALLPATLLMLLLSARSGALAQRIGPRAQLTAGPLILAAGLLLLARIGPGTSWVPDVLPGAIVLGLGLVTFVAPLTATVMGSVSADHVSVASGVNNAIARTASLASLAVIPGVSGLAEATGQADVTTAFRIALVIAASIAVAGGARLLRRPRAARPGPQLGPAHDLPGRRTSAPARSGPLPGAGRGRLTPPPEVIRGSSSATPGSSSTRRPPRSRWRARASSIES